MPANTSAAPQAGSRTHPIARLVSVSGTTEPATTRDAGQQAAAGGTVDTALGSAVRKSVAHVDGGGARKLKAALAEAQAGMGG